MKHRTNWSQPKTNIFSAVLSLRSALSGGYNAVLIKMNNEDCDHPITEKNSANSKDINNYESRSVYTTINKIKCGNATTLEQYFTLNYMSFYGKREAVETYRKTGVLSKDNFFGVGVNHPIKVVDAIKFHQDNNNVKFANLITDKYLNEGTKNDTHFFDSYQLIGAYSHTPKKFKHKLWVVELLDKNEKQVIPMYIKLINAFLNPVMYVLKFIPKKSVLRMPEYTLYEYRIGAICNGFAVEFHIPKKFSFK